MDEQQSLLQTIREHPDDDTPRLVYADWLEEHGFFDQAEFIRGQIELAVRAAYDPPFFYGSMLSGNSAAELRRRMINDQSWAELTQRCQELLNRNRDIWLGPLKGILFHHIYRRGFIERFTVGVMKFLTMSDTVFALQPVRIAKVIKLSQTRPITSVGDVANVPQVARLAGLDLANNHVGVEGLRQLASAIPARTLTSLGLDGNLLNTSAIETLATWPSVRQLKELRLSGCGLGTVELEALAKVPLHRLESLELGMNPISAAGLRALLRAPWISQIKYLDLRGCRLNMDAIPLLLDCEGLAGIRWLDLEGSAIDRRRRATRELMTRFGDAIRFTPEFV